MKKIYLFLIFLISFTYGYSQNTADLLGNWQMDFPAMEKALKGKKKDKYDTLRQEIKTNAKKALGSRIYSFYEDGKVTLELNTGSDDQLIEGRYELVDNSGLQITVHSTVLEYTLEFHDANKLILSPVEVIDDSLFDQLILKRM